MLDSAHNWWVDSLTVIWWITWLSPWKRSELVVFIVNSQEQYPERCTGRSLEIKVKKPKCWECWVSCWIPQKLLQHFPTSIIQTKKASHLSIFQAVEAVAKSWKLFYNVTTLKKCRFLLIKYNSFSIQSRGITDEKFWSIAFEWSHTAWILCSVTPPHVQFPP